MENRRKNLYRVVKKAVVRLLLKNPDYTGRDLKKKVEKSLREEGLHYGFTERTYQNIKAEILPNLTDKPLDMPWNIGACAKYYDRIPPDTIPLLIEYQKKIEEFKQSVRKRAAQSDEILGQQFWKLLNDVITEETNVEEIEGFSFTVRLAIWVVRLHPIIKSLSLGEHELGVMIIFPILYAEAEQISELIDNEYFDTSELDKSLFSTKERPVMGIFDGIGKISKKEREYERQHNQKK